VTKLKLALFVLPIVAAGAWFLAGSRHAVHAATSEAPALPAVLVAPGRVEPHRDPVQLAFETPGRIVAIDVDEGDTVTAGQVVARLDDRLAKARVASTAAALAQARARYDLARRGPRREDVDAAKADATAAQADAAHRELELARSTRLGETGAISTTAVDTDAAAARVSDATATAASARYASLAKGTRVEQIAEAAAAVDAASAELDAAKVALDQTLLRAPHSGVILRRLAEVGALVTTMTPMPVLSVADLSQLEIRAEIDEADIASIELGKPAYATADAYGDKRWPVHVTRVTRELGRKIVRDDDPRARVDTRVLEVLAGFDGNAAPALPLGLRMYVHVQR
jgi:HlyD family secretion protein